MPKSLITTKKLRVAPAGESKEAEAFRDSLHKSFATAVKQCETFEDTMILHREFIQLCQDKLGEKWVVFVLEPAAPLSGVPTYVR